MPDEAHHGEDGSPVNRHREIDDFLKRLSPWDLIYLRRKLGQVNLQEVGAKHFAQCTDLPPEILAIISAHLSLTDFQSLRCVSKAWKSSWMRYAVLVPAVRNHFPGMMEVLQPDEGNIERLFLQAAARHGAQLGDPSRVSSLFVPWTSSDARLPADGQTKRWFDQSLISQDSEECSLWGDRQEPPQHLYNDGQLVWMPYQGRIFLDDLRTGYRIHFRAEVDLRRGRRMEKLVAFSKQLVVLDVSDYDGSGIHYLAVYHIEERRWKEKAIPSPIDQCSAHGSTVVLGCLSGEILTWEWDGKLQYLPPDNFFIKDVPQSGFAGWSGGFIGVLFHPVDTKCFWLVWVHPHFRKKQPVSKCDALFTTHIVRYTRQTEGWQASAHFEQGVCSSRDMEFAHQIFWTDHPWVCEKAGEYGTYTVVAFRKVRGVFQKDGIYWNEGHVQCFNVATETFDTFNYPIRLLQRGFDDPPPSGLAYSDDSEHIRLWDGVIYLAGRRAKTAFAGFYIQRMDKGDDRGSDGWFESEDVKLKPEYLRNNHTSMRVDKHFLFISGRHGYLVCPLTGGLPAKLQAATRSITAYCEDNEEHFRR